MIERTHRSRSVGFAESNSSGRSPTVSSINRAPNTQNSSTGSTSTQTATLDRSIDPITLLGRSGGKRVTDSLEVFSMPERNAAGEYEIHFFTHGLRHYPASAQHRAAECTIGEELMLMHDYSSIASLRLH